jgi:hypothetical protein
MIFQITNHENKISLSEFFFGSPFNISVVLSFREIFQLTVGSTKMIDGETSYHYNFKVASYIIENKNLF